MVVMENLCGSGVPTAALGGAGGGGGSSGVDHSAVASHHRSWYDHSSAAAAAATVTSPDELADAYFKGQQNYFSQVQGAYQGRLKRATKVFKVLVPEI